MPMWRFGHSATNVNGTTHEGFSVKRFAHDGEKVFRSVLLKVDRFRHAASKVFHGFSGTAAL